MIIVTENAILDANGLLLVEERWNNKVQIVALVGDSQSVLATNENGPISELIEMFREWQELALRGETIDLRSEEE